MLIDYFVKEDYVNAKKKKETGNTQDNSIC